MAGTHGHLNTCAPTWAPTRVHRYVYTFIYIGTLLRYRKINLKQVFNEPIKKAHHVGPSVVVTIDPSHVKRLQIDDMTFFIQKPIENGILLEMRKLNTQVGNQT